MNKVSNNAFALQQYFTKHYLQYYKNNSRPFPDDKGFLDLVIVLLSRRILSKPSILQISGVLSKPSIPSFLESRTENYCYVFYRLSSSAYAAKTNAGFSYDLSLNEPGLEGNPWFKLVSNWNQLINYINQKNRSLKH